MRIALVVSEYHEFITSRLETGARAALRDAGVSNERIETFLVPGAYELAQAAHKIASTRKWQGVVCLGCLIRGETPHFDYIARSAADGILRAAQDTGVPVGFGVLTTNTAEEAIARAGEGSANKGHEAATAVLKMVRLYGRLGRKAPAGDDR